MTLLSAPRLATASGRHRVPAPRRPAPATGASTRSDAVEARILGRDLAELVHDPAGLAAAADAVMRRLADPTGPRPRVATLPGGARAARLPAPLQRTAWGAFRRRIRGLRASTLLPIAEALLRAPTPELRLLAVDLLAAALPTEPERAWNLLRRAARQADRCESVDALASAWASGILREPYRWAELEQLVYSPSTWERRLVGATIAAIPFVDRSVGRSPDVAARGLTLVADLIGDREPEVAAGLSGALRSLALVDPDAVVMAARREAALARTTLDGHRARVLRDALPRLPAAAADELRATLAGIRRSPTAPATSRAAAIAAEFGLAHDPAMLPERELS